MALKIWKDTTTANTVTEGNQYTPDIIGLANGNTLVVWTEANNAVAAGTGADIMGQLYDPTGAKIGAPIFLNETYGSGRSEYAPEVVATPDGGFILTYTYYGNSEYDQLYRRFDADGAPTGQQGYVVNDASGGTTYTDFEMVYRPDGSAVVTYRRDTGTDEDLMYRVINADGSIGSEVQVRYDQDPSGYQQGDPDNPTAAVLNDGRVIVAYQEEDYDIYGAEYSVINTDGTVTQRFNVTPATTRQDDVDVAALADGGFVITWREGNVLKGQIYNADESKEGGVLDLATGTDAKTDAKVTALNDGGFALAWIDRTDKEISLRAYDENGAKAGAKQDLVYGGFDAYALDLSTSPDGRLMVAWTVYNDGSYSSSDAMHAIVDPRDALIVVTDGTPTTARRQGGEIEGSAADDIFYGLEGSDDLSGNKGSDSLYGDRGADELGGGKGHDMLWAGKGLDEVSGGKGDDQMWGGKGADVFVFNAGDDRDTIKDFGRGQDRLELDDALWTGFKSAEDVVDDHARIKDGDIVLTFGDGDRLVLEDYTNLRALEDLIDIV